MKPQKTAMKDPFYFPTFSAICGKCKAHNDYVYCERLVVNMFLEAKLYGKIREEKLGCGLTVTTEVKK